jgi:O-antigen/teichoic acid export membrane protein
VLIPVALVMAAFAEPLLYVWTGNISLAQQTAPLLALLSLGTLCNGIMYVPYSMQLAYGWTGFAVRVNIVAVCIMVPFILWAVPRFGAIGGAWAWLALNAGYVHISTHFMHRRLLHGEKWRWYRDAFFKPLVVGSITVLVLRQWVTLPQDRAPTLAALAGITLLLMGVGWAVVPASKAFLRLQFKTLRTRLSNG